VTAADPRASGWGDVTVVHGEVELSLTNGGSDLWSAPLCQRA
jgi:hypothetical protein